jgi:hypothetical protein
LMYKHTLFSLSPKAEQIELFMKWIQLSCDNGYYCK